MAVAYPFLLEVLVVLASAVVVGEAFEQLRLPSVAGELLSGIILGPTLLGIMTFSTDLEAVSSISLFFIIFLIGIEMNTETLRQHVPAALLLAFTSFGFPLLVAFAVTILVLPFGLVSSFVFSLAVAVPSISIVSVLVVQYDLLEKKSGQIILSTVVVADVLAFVLLAGASSSLTATLGVLARTAILIGAFLFVDWFLNVRPQQVRKALGRLGKMARREDLAYAMLVVVGLGVAWVLQAVGLSYIIGAFFAGLIVHDGLIGREAFKEVSKTMTKMNRAVFIPLFFGFAGLQADLSVSGYGLLPGLFAVLVCSIVPATVVTNFAAKRFLQVNDPEGPRQVALTLGGRGAVGIVVSSVALSEGIISGEAYSLIVIGTLVVSLLVPLFLGRKGVAD